MLSIYELFEMDWKQFYQLVKDEASKEKQVWRYDTLKERLWVLEEARDLFGEDKYSDICKGLRTRIAGVSDDENRELYGCVIGAHKPNELAKRAGTDANRGKFRESLEWHWFGVMNATNRGKKPTFKERIKCDSEGISDALCCIPLDGEVTEKDFHCFVKLFCEAVAPEAQNPNPVGTVTRLLAYRRPDYFVSLNSASVKKLSAVYRKYNVPREAYDLPLKDYWRKVVKPILSTKWGKPESPDFDDDDGLEARIWRCRAAILDVLFYTRKPKKLHPYRTELGL